MATKKDTVEKIASKINPALDALSRSIDSLRLDERNARLHKKRSIETIKTSLATYGQQKPIVALTNGVVIAGNGTLEAARELGWDRLAVVTFDNEDEARARAFAIMDNRSAELSEWDFEVLADEIKTLPSDFLDRMGFADFELDPLLRADWKPRDIDDNYESPDPSALGSRAETIFLKFTNPERFRFVRARLDDLKMQFPDDEDADLVFAMVGGKR